MDRIVDKLAAFGVPGLVLLVAVASTGLAGTAAVVAALAALGGPLGILGGVGVLGVTGLVSRGIATYGTESIFKGVVEKLRDKGKSHDEIRAEIESYPLTKGLKRSLLEHLDRLK